MPLLLRPPYAWYDRGSFRRRRPCGAPLTRILAAPVLCCDASAYDAARRLAKPSRLYLFCTVPPAGLAPSGRRRRSSLSLLARQSLDDDVLVDAAHRVSSDNRRALFILNDRPDLGGGLSRPRGACTSAISTRRPRKARRAVLRREPAQIARRAKMCPAAFATNRRILAAFHHAQRILKTPDTCFSNCARKPAISSVRKP